MFRSRFLLAAAVAVAAALAAPNRSEATFTLTLNQTGFGPVTITDGTAPDPTPADGLISFTGNYGTFTTTLTAAASNSATNASPAHLNLTQLVLVNNSASAQTLTLTITDDSYTAPANVKKILDSRLAASTLTGAGSTVDLVNSIDGVAGTPLHVASPMGNDQHYNDYPATSSTYQIQMVVTIHLDPGATYVGSGDAWVVPAPAPAGLVMLASALPFAGLLRLRRRLSKAEAATAA